MVRLTRHLSTIRAFCVHFPFTSVFRAISEYFEYICRYELDIRKELVTSFE